MSEIIKMNYAKMADMASAFNNACQQLESTKSTANIISQLLEGGALLGVGGTEYANAVRAGLIPALDRLGAKMTELEGDINNAVSEHQATDKTDYYQ